MRGVRGGTGSAALPPGRELEGGGSHRTAGKRRRIPAAHGHGSSTAPRGHRGQSRARTVSPHPQEMGALLEELWGWHSAGDMAEQGGVRNAPLSLAVLLTGGRGLGAAPPGAPRTALPHAAACPACSGTRNPWAWCSGGTRPQVTSSSSRCPHSPSWHRSLPRPEATRHRHREAGVCPKPLGGSCCKQGRSWATGFGGPQAGGIRHRRAPRPGRLAVRGHGSYKLCGAPRGAGTGSFGISGLLGVPELSCVGPHSCAPPALHILLLLLLLPAAARCCSPPPRFGTSAEDFPLEPPSPGRKQTSTQKKNQPSIFGGDAEAQI